MELFKVNVNINPFFHSIPEVPSESIEEIANAVIPILNLFPKTALLTNFTVGALHLKSQVEKRDQMEVVHLAVTVSSLSLPIFFPKVGMLPSHLYASYTSMQKCYQCIQSKDYLEAYRHLISALSTLAYMGSVFFMTPEWIFLSVLAQTIRHFSELQVHYRKDQKYILAVSDAVMMCIRGYSAFFQGKTLFRNRFGDKVTDIIEFKTLLKEAEKRPDKSLDKLLAEKGISSYVQNLEEGKELTKQQGTYLPTENKEEKKSYEIQDLQKLTFETFHGINFSNILMRNCTFWRCHFIECNFKNIRLEQTKFCYTSFVNCLLNEIKCFNGSFFYTKFDRCKIQNFTVKYSEMDEAYFDSCRIIQSVFERVQLEGSIFNSTVQNTRFINIKSRWFEIAHSHLEENFFEGGTYSGLIMYLNKGCKNQARKIDLSKAHILEDSIFDYFKCVLPNQENPKIIFPWSAEGVGYYTSLEKLCLVDSGSNPIAARYLPPDIDVPELKREMNEIFSKGDHAKQPIAQTILDNSAFYPNVQKVVTYANELVVKGDGVLLPGGENVTPRLYGVALKSNVSQGDSYSYDRDLFEIALLDAAKRHHKPVLGICRGSQIGNVYYGGTLQDVKGHFDRERSVSVSFDLPRELRSKITDILGESFSFIALHEQASKRIGKGLYVVAEDDGIPKLIVSKDLSCIFMQLHPEVAYNIRSYWFKKKEKLLQKNSQFTRKVLELYRIHEESGVKAKRFFEFFRQKAIATRLVKEVQRTA